MGFYSSPARNGFVRLARLSIAWGERIRQTKSWVAEMLQSRSTVLARSWLPRPMQQPVPLSPHRADVGMRSAHFRLAIAIAFRGTGRAHVIVR